MSKAQAQIQPEKHPEGTTQTGYFTSNYLASKDDGANVQAVKAEILNQQRAEVNAVLSAAKSGVGSEFAQARLQASVEKAYQGSSQTDFAEAQAAVNQIVRQITTFLEKREAPEPSNVISFGFAKGDDKKIGFVERLGLEKRPEMSFVARLAAEPAPQTVGPAAA